MALQRWFLSSNAKDIGILYLIFALFLGLLGTAFSVLIRIESIADNQLYSEVVTAYATLMIFFVLVLALKIFSFWLVKITSGIKILYLLILNQPVIAFTIGFCVYNLICVLLSTALILYSGTELFLMVSDLIEGYSLAMAPCDTVVYEADNFVYIKGEGIEVPFIKTENLGTPPLGPGGNGGPSNIPLVAPIPANNNGWMVELSNYLQEEHNRLNRPNLILKDLNIKFTSNPLYVNVSEFPNSAIHRLRVEQPAFFELFPGHTKVPGLIRDINTLI